MHIKLKLKIFLPLFVNHQQRGKNQNNQFKFFSPFLSKTKTKSIRGDLIPIKKYVNEVPLDTNLNKMKTTS